MEDRPSSGRESDSGHPSRSDRGAPTVLSIADLLRRDLKVPDYQRPYKWGVRQVGQLVEDIQRFRDAQRYRIGTVILHEHDDGADIVDGQQRFVTFVLIAAWISRNVDECDVPLLSAHAVSAHGIEISTSRIQRNYQYLCETLGSWTPGEQESFAEFFLRDCEVTVLPLTELDEAFQMFDSQNTRGRALYPTDLLKAL